MSDYGYMQNVIYSLIETWHRQLYAADQFSIAGSDQKSCCRRVPYSGIQIPNEQTKKNIPESVEKGRNLGYNSGITKAKRSSVFGKFCV